MIGPYNFFEHAIGIPLVVPPGVRLQVGLADEVTFIVVLIKILFAFEELAAGAVFSVAVVVGFVEVACGIGAAMNDAISILGFYKVAKTIVLKAGVGLT